MKMTIATLIFLLGANVLLQAQAIPTGTAAEPRYNPGPTLPSIDGNIQYAISLGETAQSGYFGSQGWTYTTNLSGDVEYIGRSTVRPFSMLYAGGVLLSTYTNAQTQFYQSLTISQGFVGHGWAVGFSDSVSYLPQSPTTGLAGIPGVGDLGFQPTPDPTAPAQSVLTNYGKRLTNTASGNIERELNARTSISGTGSYGILRFLGDNVPSSNLATTALDSTQITGNVSLNRRLSVRSNASVSAYYSTFSYGNNTTSFNSKGINVTFNRQMTKALSLSLSAGPQINSAYTAVTSFGNIRVPGSLNASVNAGLSYTRKFTSASLGYSRGINAGSGVQPGARSDSVSGSLQHTIGRDWSLGFTGAFTQTTGLALTGTTNSVFGGTQLSRRFLKSFSAYVGYTGIHQSIPAQLAGQSAFSGFSQAVSAGITFSPRAARLGQF